MATLSVQTVSETAADVTFNNADDASGDLIPNKNGKLFLILKNPGASSASVTVTAQDTSREFAGYGPMAKSDLTISLAASEEKILGPLPTGPWNNTSDQVALSYSGTGAADVDVAALELG